MPPSADRFGWDPAAWQPTISLPGTAGSRFHPSWWLLPQLEPPPDTVVGEGAGGSGGAGSGVGAGASGASGAGLESVADETAGAGGCGVAERVTAAPLITRTGFPVG